MKKLLVIIVSFMIVSCGAYNPSANYAKQHKDKEFKSWKHTNKKIDKALKSNPKCKKC